jgi:hypothetical protein
MYQTYGIVDPIKLAQLRFPLRVFLRLYVGQWEALPNRLDVLEVGQVSLHFYFRVFRVQDSEEKPDTLENMVKAGWCLTGVRCQRARFCLPVPNRPNESVKLAESRCFVYLNTLLRTERPVYQVLSLRDFGGCGGLNDFLLECPAGLDGKHLTGFAMFLAVVSSRLNDWREEWESVLEKIEGILATEVS